MSLFLCTAKQFLFLQPEPYWFHLNTIVFVRAIWEWKHVTLILQLQIKVIILF